jgi:hypothetical protein
MSSIRLRAIFAAMGTLAFSVSVSAAMAQTRLHRYSDEYDPRIRAPYSEGVIYCVPQCREDLNPCDPLYFKRADGRCSGDNRRR